MIKKCFHFSSFHWTLEFCEPVSDGYKSTSPCTKNLLLVVSNFTLVLFLFFYTLKSEYAVMFEYRFFFLLAHSFSSSFYVYP